MTAHAKDTIEQSKCNGNSRQTSNFGEATNHMKSTSTRREMIDQKKPHEREEIQKEGSSRSPEGDNPPTPPKEDVTTNLQIHCVTQLRQSTPMISGRIQTQTQKRLSKTHLQKMECGSFLKGLQPKGRVRLLLKPVRLRFARPPPNTLKNRSTAPPLHCSLEPFGATFWWRTWGLDANAFLGTCRKKFQGT